MQRVFTPDHVDKLLNHVSIRPTVERGDNIISAGAQLSNICNIMFADNYGYLFFQFVRHGLYKFHGGFMPGHRGSYAKRKSQDAISQMWFAYGARAIISAVPLQLPAPRLMVRWLGFTSTGRDALQEFFVLKGPGYGRNC